MFEVYAHTSPSGKTYVGWTSRGMAHRWRKHCNAAGKGSPLPFHRAIRKYGPRGFSHLLLERMSTEAGAKRAEQLWIKELGTFGQYNATVGGDGNMGGVPWNRGKKMSPEACARNSAARLGSKHSPETIAKMVAVRARPDVRARMSASHLGKRAPAETREKMSAAHAARWAALTEVERSVIGGKSAAKRRGVKRTPEQKARMSAGVRANTTPEERSARSRLAAQAMWAKGGRRG